MHDSRSEPFQNHSSWYQANQDALMGALARVQAKLQAKINGENPPEAPDRTLSPPSSLEQLCHLFGLSPFERDLLLLCAGMELDASFPALCAAAQGDSQKNYPTFSLALATLSQPQWNALTPDAPLRRWRMIEIGAGTVLTLSPLRIDERILHYLTGLQYLDERLKGLVEPFSVDSELVPSHQQLAQHLAASWLQAFGKTPLPIVQLCGDLRSSKRAIAAALCQQVGLNLHILHAQALPTPSSELHPLLQLWAREAVLSHSALLLDCDATEDVTRNGAIALILERLHSPLIVSSRDRLQISLRPQIAADVRQPTPNEQRLLWQTALGDRATPLNGQVDLLVSHFNLNSPAIQAVCTEAFAQLENPLTEDSLSKLLWDTCCKQARPHLDDLSQRIEPGATWEDLVLPDTQRRILRDISAHIRQRAKVYEYWGFAKKGDRGLGISALFAGPSGTGKTMAAEVLAQELRLDLYRIDLSSVVSKYIGETEKNLRHVFDAAESGGAILLFDEADALFGKRSDVKDSHDRYANMEVSYLLQRMESYRGLAILTTNLKTSIDQAFLRRLRFVVQFPFPDASQRAEIWQRIFPKQMPTEALDFKKLAKLNVAGGNIRNIAMNAAFLAADANESVTMKHLLRAAQSEYIKLERPLTDAEVKGWV
ncbi:ATP-binding protein [Geitlerinema splendidum]|nr:ATP-binding protein [Geitlerinema splendidum]